jgi:hypothetical protein
MNRNNALMDLAPGQELRISEKQLGVFFCGETFQFVLNPRTRRAAQRVARWHGCRFRFNPANGCAAFVKRDWVSGSLLSRLESALLWSEHALSQARLRVRAATFTHPYRARAAPAGR